VNEIIEDYVRDFEVEVFRDGKSTGIIFSVQLKSTASPAYSAAGEFVSHKLSSRHVNRLAREVRHPVLLIVACVEERRLFWTAPQLDAALLRGRAASKGLKTFTIRVPTANLLPSSRDRMLDVLGRIETLLSSKRLMEVSAVDFAASVKDYTDPAALSANLRDKSDYLEVRRGWDLARSRDFTSARAIIQGVSSDPRASIAVRFNALLANEEAETMAIARTGAPQALLGRLALDTAHDMQELTRKGPPVLKLYALMARISGEYYVLAHDDFGLFMNWKAHERDGDIWWRTQLIFERAAVSRRLVRRFNQFLRVGRRATASGNRGLLSAFLRIVAPASMVVSRLELEGLGEAAAALQASVFQICKFTAALAAEMQDDRAVARSAMAASQLSRDPNGECFEWARMQLPSIQDEKYRDWADTVIKNQAQRLWGVRLPDDPYQQATAEQIYQNMASALGIDMGDPNDKLARLVQIGIADRDLGRVLKNCEHLSITLIQSLLAVGLRLPTMGRKIIRCNLHRHSLWGDVLDDAYHAFKGTYCDGCKDCMPRSPDWEYDKESSDP
jgi:hypothetical protein